ncbi:glycosyltransferase [Lewinella sp. JB7]|uniref:glycosyltransferase n=1 Tax=Lewinella sp. JB7 TaxID=2962887 RepID=UPI0020C9EE33|nr:glycosyltransferase [Lewinella sp. JB7]
MRSSRPRQFKILFAGRLTHAKRCDLLIKAVSELRNRGIDCSLDIVGDGATYDENRDLAIRLSIEAHVHFHGALYDDDLVPFFSLSDVFVIPGKVGLSIVHALSYGLPIITSDADIHSPEVAIVKAGVNGAFFENLSLTSLTDVLAYWHIKLANDNHGLKQRIQKTVVAAGYTPDQMAKTFLNHFNRMTDV